MKLKKENGITMISLVITIIILVILTNMLVYNARDSIQLKALTNLDNDIQLLREKVSDYYNGYGQIPAEIKYTNVSQLSEVLSGKNDIGDFFVIDLEAMQGITLNYGKDYEKIKQDKNNADNYTDVYVINENSHNIFYIKGISIKENNYVKTYYTDYTQPDDTTIDLRYIDGILIPDNYYYIGKSKDNSGNEYVVISNVKDEEIDSTNQNQYTWTKQISDIESVPASITLESSQKEHEFIKSVNAYKGYFKNTEGKVQYKIIEEKWSDVYTEESKYTDENGQTIVIPNGVRISLEETANAVNKGIVIKDTNENEWIWIEVPQNITEEASTDEEIEEALQEYVEGYRYENETDEYEWEDQYFEGCGMTEVEYNALKSKMLQSIKKNNGFWISRYEIGDGQATLNNEARTTSSGEESTPVSKPNQIPYNYIKCSDAQILSSGFAIDENKESSLLFGIQWDLVCKFLEKKATINNSDIKTDSTDLGNYNNKSLLLNSGKYNDMINVSSLWKAYNVDTSNYVTNSKTNNNQTYNVLLTTGATEQTNKMNIYDIAGNLNELTLERSTIEGSSQSACRGGSYCEKGDESPVNCHITINPNEVFANVGFRVAMY